MKGMNKPIQKKIIVLIMKWTLIQTVLAVVFSVWAYGFETKGQELLEKKVSIHVEKESIKSVLHLIERQATLKFTYQSQLIRSFDPVSLELSEVKVGDVLNQLLGPQITYEVLGKQIILKPVLRAAEMMGDAAGSFIPQSILVTGQIVDSDGQPLPGTNILVKGTSNGTTTDVDGKFSLNVDNEDAVLVISFIGYLSQEIRVGSQTNITVTMEADVQSLSEVVVVGYGTQRKQDVTGSISSIKSDDLKTQGANTIQKQLSGDPWEHRIERPVMVAHYRPACFNTARS